MVFTLSMKGGLSKKEETSAKMRHEKSHYKQWLQSNLYCLV